jgi:hypothetical protein
MKDNIIRFIGVYKLSEYMDAAVPSRRQRDQLAYASVWEHRTSRSERLVLPSSHGGNRKRDHILANEEHIYRAKVKLVIVGERCKAFIGWMHSGIEL